MDSLHSVVSPLKSSSVFAEPEKQNANLFAENQSYSSRGVAKESKETIHNVKDFLGVLEVYINQARDIHNICIYQNQDVYAKLCITSDPENTVSSKIINGGGRNPVFNENLRLDVCNFDSSLKCEIWMLSRVRNYLEDQLLGFALVPLSDVFLNNGKLEKEFSLSSTDLFHSPAGYVQLALSYVGASPEVIPIPASSPSVATDAAVQDAESPDSSPCEFDRIEFPDPKVVNENHQMVSEYCGITDANSEDSHSSDCPVTPATEIQLGEKLSTCNISLMPFSEHNSPPGGVSTNGAPSASLHASSKSSENPGDSKSPNEEHSSPPKDNPEEKSADVRDAESNECGGPSGNTSAKPAFTVNIETQPNVVQQDIVDMYMKSMQQFTESLAKMKLPGEFESQPTSSGNSSSDQKTPTSGSKVFYGSRAFF